MKFSITLKNHLKALNDVFIYGTFSAILSLILFFIGLSVEISITTACVYFLLAHLIPTIIIHTVHYFQVKNCRVTINDNSFVYNDKIILENEIDFVKLYGSSYFLKNQSGVESLAFSKNYYQMIIKMKDGKIFIINELLGGREIANLIGFYLKKIKILKVPTFYFGLMRKN